MNCDYENLSEFNDLLKRHNEFVRNHPDYFPSEVMISISSGDDNSPIAFEDFEFLKQFRDVEQVIIFLMG